MPTFRPLTSYPGKPTRDAERLNDPFRATWDATRALLDYELDQLDAHSIVVEIDVTERELRLDGWPRSDARPASPAVVVSFESSHGPLRYACDRFATWKANLRAIALGLEALRKVERFGIARRGEQYTGWRQIAAQSQSTSDARAFLRAELERCGETWRGLDDRALRRRALAVAHPDVGGTRDGWERVKAAAEALKEA